MRYTFTGVSLVCALARAHDHECTDSMLSSFCTCQMCILMTAGKSLTIVGCQQAAVVIGR